ncbi:MAG: hypothetical protein FJ215_01445 [Ignavibacteria bacterium]|nr:hypothetical protein [Ignavibacteria bacterium]
MQDRQPFRLTARLVLGSLALLVGLLLTLDNLDVLSTSHLFRYWPSLLIVFGLSQTLLQRDLPNRLVGLFLAAAGSFLLLDRFEIITFSFWSLVPLALLFIGGHMVYRSIQAQRASSQTGVGASGADSSSTVNLFAFMGGIERTNSSRTFMGGEVTAIMGGCELDLSRAVMKENQAILHLFTVWGGIEITVPPDWGVSVEVVPLLGAIEDTTTPPRDGASKILVVKGYVVMAGAEIKNNGTER